MKFLMKNALLILLVGTSSAVLAEPPTASIDTCKLIDVKIETVQLLDGIEPVVPFAANASDCLGAFVGNNSAFEKPDGNALDNNVGTNLGYDEDGWLNKENYNDWWNGPGAFVDESNLLDLDGDGDADDPGWVLVGKEDQNGFEGETSTDGNLEYNHQQLVSLENCETVNGSSTSCLGGDAVKGEWIYTPPAENPQDLTDLIGGDFFDQVAIVFKAGNAFAIYNFNVFDLGLPPTFAGDYNFAFTGTWDISQTLGHGLSNLSLWARDPANITTSVPEPSTLVLLIMSGLFFIGKRRKI